MMMPSLFAVLSLGVSLVALGYDDTPTSDCLETGKAVLAKSQTGRALRYRSEL